MSARLEHELFAGDQKKLPFLYTRADMLGAFVSFMEHLSCLELPVPLEPRPLPEPGKVRGPQMLKVAEAWPLVEEWFLCWCDRMGIDAKHPANRRKAPDGKILEEWRGAELGVAVIQQYMRTLQTMVNCCNAIEEMPSTFIQAVEGQLVDAQELGLLNYVQGSDLKFTVSMIGMVPG